MSCETRSRTVGSDRLAEGLARAPNLSDLTRYDTARSKEFEVPAPELDPEKFLSSEVGFKTRSGPLSGQVAYYYTWIEDMILRTPTGNTISGNNEVTKRNGGEGYVQGVELSAAYAFTPQWSARVSGSWMDGRCDAYRTNTTAVTRDVITRLMPLTAEVAVRWQTTDGRYWCELAANLADRADELSIADREDTQRIPPDGTPGYAVYHLRTGAQLTPYLDLTLALENLANEDYRIHGSGVNEPGRNLVCSARAKF